MNASAPICQPAAASSHADASARKRIFLPPPPAAVRPPRALLLAAGMGGRVLLLVVVVVARVRPRPPRIDEMAGAWVGLGKTARRMPERAALSSIRVGKCVSWVELGGLAWLDEQRWWAGNSPPRRRAGISTAAACSAYVLDGGAWISPMVAGARYPSPFPPCVKEWGRGAFLSSKV